MAGVKRASDGQSSTAKRSPPTKQAGILPEDQLQAMGKDDLISYILELQAHIASAAQAPPSPPATPNLSEEEVSWKATKARDMMAKGIKSQMKWKPSCKTGTAKFSYSGVVASAPVFLAMFRLAADWNKKQVRFDPAEFQHTTGTDHSTIIRYAHLKITGSKVTVRWDAAELTFTVTGSYGL